MASTGAPGKPRKRRIPIEHYDRVSLMLISMVPYGEIVKQLAMAFGKPRTYIRTVIKAVHEDWETEAASVATTRRHQVRNGFEALYMKAVSKGDLQVAAKVLTELGKLDGCYVPSEVTVNHGGSVGVGIALGTLGFKNPQEVAGRIEYLKAQLAAKGPTALAPGQASLVAQAHLAGESPDNQADGVSLPNPASVIDAPDPDDGEDVS